MIAERQAVTKGVNVYEILELGRQAIARAQARREKQARAKADHEADEKTQAGKDKA